MNDTIERLEAEFTANVDRANATLAKFQRSVYGASSDIKKNLDSVESQFGKLFARADPSKAAAAALGGFRKSLLSVGESIPIVGASFGALGGAGLAAAGGIAALTALMERTDVAIDYGAEIAKMSKTVGVAADFLQEFNFAAHQNEISTESADEALKGLNTSLGLVQSGLARKQLANAFKALGFTPEQLRQYHDVGDLFPVLAQRIGEVGNQAERAAIAKRLGISELLPMLSGGAQGFNDLAKKAQALDIVMDASLVKQAAEAKEKLSEISDVMKAKANIQFAQFADTLIAVKTAFMNAEVAGLSFLAKLTGTENPVAKLKEDAQGLNNLLRQNGGVAGLRRNPVGMGLAAGMESDVTLQKQLLARIKAANAAANKVLKGDGSTNPPTQLVSPTGGKTKTDLNAQTADEAVKLQQEALATALGARVKAATEQLDLDKQALAPLATILADIDARAQAESEQLTATTKAKDAALDKQLADAKEKAKNHEISDATFRQLAAAIKSAKDSEDEALTDGQIAIARKAILDKTTESLAALNRDFAQRQALGQIDTEILGLQGDMATTLAARRAIAAQQLASEHQAQLDDLQHQLDNKDITQAQHDASVAAQGKLYAVQQQQQGIQNADPIQTYMRSIQDLDTLVKTDAVQAWQGLNDQLGQSAANALHLKGALGQLFSQLVSLLMQRLDGGLLTSALGLFGFASGGSFVVGGGNTSTDNQVVAFKARRNERVTITPPGQALLNSVQASGAVQPIMVGRAPAPLYFDLRGAVVTQDLLGQMNRIAAAHADGAVVRSAQGVRKQAAYAQLNGGGLAG